MVCKAEVLFRVEDFQQRTCGVASEITSDFIKFVEHKYGIFAAALSQFLQYSAGHSADISSPMSPDVGFISYPAERYTNEFSSHSSCDGFAE